MPLRTVDPDTLGDARALVFMTRPHLVTGWIGSPRNILIDEHDAIGWFEIYEALQLDLALSGYAEVFRRLAEEIPARYNKRKG